MGVLCPSMHKRLKFFRCTTGPLIYSKSSAFPTVAVLLVLIFNVLMGYRPEIVAAHSPPTLIPG